MSYADGGRRTGFLSLVLSLYILYIFGTELESIYRTREFLAIVIATALSITIFGTLAHFWKPNAFEYYYGIQGIVTGLIVLYACHYPHRQLMLMFVIPVPTWAVAALFTAFGFLRMPSAPVSAVAAAGFAIVYYRLHLRIVPLFNWIPRRQSRHRLQLRRSNDEMTGTAVPYANATMPTLFDSGTAATSSDPSKIVSLEDQLDQLLEKVSRHGRASLTSDELALLNRAERTLQKATKLNVILQSYRFDWTELAYVLIIRMACE